MAANLPKAAWGGKISRRRSSSCDSGDAKDDSSSACRERRDLAARQRATIDRDVVDLSRPPLGRVRRRRISDDELIAARVEPELTAHLFAAVDVDDGVATVERRGSVMPVAVGKGRGRHDVLELTDELHSPRIDQEP